MRIYFMGICGSAMGNAALLFKELGHEVLGADAAAYPPMSEILAEAGIEIFPGFDADRLKRLAPDRVVVGNAMSRGCPEVEWLLDQSEVPYVSLPHIIRETVLAERSPVVVAGTHGKTTTSSLVAYLLEAADEAPGWLIGGEPLDLPAGMCRGRGRTFVIEGDEYDSAFFDKRSKFIHYSPHIAVLNNLEFDHADIFRDLEDVKRSFRHFLRIVPASGCVVFNGDDPNLAALFPIPWTRIFSVGAGSHNDVTIQDFMDGPGGSSFQLNWKGRCWARINWGLHGWFNARNAAAGALAAAFAAGFEEDPAAFDISGLKDFRGVRRRHDVLHAGPAWTVLEDFAHHPTAVSAVLEGLRAAYPDRPLTICFEPRSNTSRTCLFQRELREALSAADGIYLGAVYKAEGLVKGERLDTEKIALELRNAGRMAKAFARNEDLFDRLQQDCSKSTGGVIAFLSNGAFDGLAKKTAALAAACESV